MKYFERKKRYFNGSLIAVVTELSNGYFHGVTVDFICDGEVFDIKEFTVEEYGSFTECKLACSIMLERYHYKVIKETYKEV